MLHQHSRATHGAYVAVSDISTAQGTLSATIEVNSLLALNLPDAIDYGTRSLGEQSSSTTNIETVLTQRGNTKADVEVSGTTMNCSLLGNLPATTQSYALTDVGYASSTSLTTAAVATERNINLRVDESNELAANLYWNIAIPASGVKGVCTGANTISIIARASEEASLVDGRVQGVRYATENRSGYTGATGNFTIESDETISFYIGNVLLGSIVYDDIPADRLIFLQDLIGIARTNTTDTGLVKRAQFIQSLAAETNLTGSTILSIPQSAHTNLTAAVNFDTVSDAALQTELDKVYTGRTIRSTADAQEHVTDTLVAEGVIQSGFACGTQTVQYDGGPFDEDGTTRNQGGYYRTVQIGSQCWMKDNLNVGSKFPSLYSAAVDNGVVEKHCYDNNVGYCNAYGGYYPYYEMMNYSTDPKGICPSGWHIPSDDEFKTLELAIGMTQAEVDAGGARGNKAGVLKTGGSSGFDFLVAGKTYYGGSGFLNSEGYIRIRGGGMRVVTSSLSSIFSQSGYDDRGKSARCLLD